MDVEVGEVEYVHFAHEWGGVCSWWYVFDEPNDSFLCSDERLHIDCVGFCPPDGHLANQVREDVAVVQLLHDARGQQFRCILESVHGWLQFLDDVEDGAVVFQVLLDNDPE